jgi:carboxyl-terminal processing protease
VIVGERSFGKGSVQNVVRIPSDNPKAAIKLTTASYWRPSGQNIHRHPDSKDTDEWGVRPDPKFEVALSDEERLAYLLDRRQRDIIAGKPGAPKPKPVERGEGKNDKPFEDLALQKALKHLQAQVDGDDEKPPVVEPLKKAG